MGEGGASAGELRTFADMFCGIGGFHQAAAELGLRAVFACDSDPHCRRAYAHNHGLEPKGDIAAIPADAVPDHDLFCAGFPCQPFSIIGKRRGFEDTRGTLFFEIARILAAKRPRAVALENVRQLTTSDGGRTLDTILKTLDRIGYKDPQWRVLNALDYGVPQRRERVLIVGLLEPEAREAFRWPAPSGPRAALADVLEDAPHPRHRASDRIRAARQSAHASPHKPGIWHENKGGAVSSHPHSCALRAGASYNYLLVDGERRLTPREMLRLQGFPDTFDIVCSDAQTRRQAGNAICVPVARTVVDAIRRAVV